MDVRSDEAAVKRKKMRKGVHSCRECRRRKVRCILASPQDTVCIMCARRGSRCESQIVLDDAYGDEIMGGANNTTVFNLQHSPDHDQESSGLSTSTNLTTSSKSPDSIDIQQSALSSRPITSTRMLASAPAKPHTISTIRNALLLALPCSTDIKILISNVKSNTASFYHVHHATTQISTSSFLQPELHPVLLARQMLLLTISLQHMSPSTILHGLSNRHDEITGELAEAAISTVNSNDSLVGSLEHLDNIVLEGFYHVDCGNLRRAWLTMRRAVTVAQLLALHLPGKHRFKILDPQNDLDITTMWTSIVYMERLLSLLLGLPTSTGNTDPAPHVRPNSRLPTLPALLASVAARILDRNQIVSSEEALGSTTEIDAELVKIAEHMPTSFWQPAAFDGLERGSAAALHETKRVLDNVCYYTLVIQLHLPHMLCPTHASQRLYSKIACVSASREILLREISLRTLKPTVACCRMADFMALIAGMTLTLAHAVSHCGKHSSNLLTHQRLSDRATVKRTLDCMTSISELHQDVLAVKCAALLKDLLAIEENAARGRKHHSELEARAANENEDSLNVLIMRVPYFGTIQISRNGIANVAPLASDHDQNLDEGVTIGGIGSLHINGLKASEASVDYPMTNQASDVPKDTAVPSLGSGMVDPLLDDFVDDFYPNAAANVDDWVFQGLDTAFFDNLMHDAGDLVFDDLESTTIG